MKAICLVLPLLLVSCSYLRPVTKPYFNDDCGEGHTAGRAEIEAQRVGL